VLRKSSAVLADDEELGAVDAAEQGARVEGDARDVASLDVVDELELFDLGRCYDYNFLRFWHIFSEKDLF
jgi:hypothetical protein